MRELELLVPTLFGLEGLCAEELRRLKLPEVAAENGRVRLWSQMFRENLRIHLCHCRIICICW